MKTNCLFFALDKWRVEGGYLMFRKSSHWLMPHVLHLSEDRKTLTHFVPHEDLRTPLLALVGFYGVELDYDPQPAQPITFTGVIVGAITLLGMSTLWVGHRLVFRRARA